MEDGDMRVLVLTLQDRGQFHFDCVADAVSNGSLGADRDDQIVPELLSSLFESADNILSDVAREPFVHRGDLRTSSLKLVDRHGSDLENRIGEKVLDTLLGRGELDSICLGTGRVLDGSVGEELEQWSSCSGDGGSKRRENLFRLLHSRCRGDLRGRARIDVEEVRLYARSVHRLRGTT